MLTGILAAIAASVAGLIGWVLMATKRDQGRLERDAELARKDALLQKQMAAVAKPTDDEALKRLDDGTA